MARKTFLHGTQSVLGWIRRVVTQPREELDRWQRAARFAYDLGRTGARQLRHDRAPQMAAALAFRTLFGLVPVLVVATILVKALRGTDAFMGIVHSLLASAGLDQVRIIPPAEVAAPHLAGASETLASWLEGLVEQAAMVDLTAVGWIGLVVILYAAIGLMVTIENCFNTICRAAEGRSWIRRVPLYWFILTISPVAIGLMTYVNGRFDTWLGSLDTGPWLRVSVELAWGYATVWLWMLAVYLLVPNTYLRPRPVLIGSFVAATLLQIGAGTMGAYLEHAFSISQLYSSLGLIPLFMFWVYLMWLVVLFGLQVAATLQMLRGRRPQELSAASKHAIIDPACVLSVMEVIAERFGQGKATSLTMLATSSAIPESLSRLMVDRLVTRNFLHWIEGAQPSVSLARPPDEISVESLIEIGFDLVDAEGTAHRSAWVDHLRQAQLRCAARVDLATLLRSPDPCPGGTTENSPAL